MKVKDLIKHLQTHYNREDEIAYSLWPREDVTICAEEEHYQHPKLTDDEKDMVLDHMNHYHNAEYGMNWQFMCSCIDNIVEE